MTTGTDFIEMYAASLRQRRGAMMVVAGIVMVPLMQVALDSSNQPEIVDLIVVVGLASALISIAAAIKGAEIQSKWIASIARYSFHQGDGKEPTSRELLRYALETFEIAHRRGIDGNKELSGDTPSMLLGKASLQQGTILLAVACTVLAGILQLGMN